MSDPILPFDVWQSGTNQNSIPANRNALRAEILTGTVLSDSTNAQPGSPSDGDIYIMTGAATGAQWSTFDEFDLAIYRSGTWLAFAPSNGIVVNIAGTLFQWNGAAYVVVAGPDTEVNIITETTTARTMAPADAGIHTYIRCTNAGATTLTFDSGQGYTADMVFNIRAVGAGGVTLAVSGVTLTPPKNGSLVLEQNDTVSVIMTSTTDGDVMGSTEAAP